MHRCCSALLWAVLATLPLSDAFSIPTTVQHIPTTRVSLSRLPATASEKEGDGRGFIQVQKQNAKKIIATASLCFALIFTTAVSVPTLAHAYNENDFASETVQATVSRLQQARGNTDETLKAYEALADIITEGTGVGGAINYKGVQLDRGYVADEDTSIYNPGLTLLTESEKERLLQAVIETRKFAGAGQWNGDLEAGFDFLRTRLDPLHIYELRGYLRIFPYYSSAVYLMVLAVQQLARNVFSTAYLFGVAAIFAPALILVLAGPQ